MNWSLEQIDEYIEALLINAEQLIRESQLLLNSEAYARSFTLSHLAREELAKISMLEAAGTRLLAGQNVDFKTLRKRLSDHKAKLRGESAQALIIAAGIGHAKLTETLKQYSGQIVDHRNNNKNDSIYVGIKDGAISKPSELFSKHKAERTLKLARYALVNHTTIRFKLGPYSNRPPIKIPDIDPATFDLSKLDLAAVGRLLLAAMTTTGNDATEEVEGAQAPNEASVATSSTDTPH